VLNKRCFHILKIVAGWRSPSRRTGVRSNSFGWHAPMRAPDEREVGATCRAVVSHHRRLSAQYCRSDLQHLWIFLNTNGEAESVHNQSAQILGSSEIVTLEISFHFHDERSLHLRDAFSSALRRRHVLSDIPRATHGSCLGDFGSPMRGRPRFGLIAPGGEGLVVTCEGPWFLPPLRTMPSVNGGIHRWLMPTISMLAPHLGQGFAMTGFMAEFMAVRKAGAIYAVPLAGLRHSRRPQASQASTPSAARPR